MRTRRGWLPTYWRNQHEGFLVKQDDTISVLGVHEWKMQTRGGYDEAILTRSFFWTQGDHPGAVFYAPRKPEWTDIAALAGDDEIGGWSAGD